MTWQSITWAECQAPSRCSSKTAKTPLELSGASQSGMLVGPRRLWRLAEAPGPCLKSRVSNCCRNIPAPKLFECSLFLSLWTVTLWERRAHDLDVSLLAVTVSFWKENANLCGCTESIAYDLPKRYRHASSSLHTTHEMVVLKGFKDNTCTSHKGQVKPVKLPRRGSSKVP